MKHIKISLVALLLCCGLELFGQQSADNSNLIHLNTKKSSPEVVKLPLIKWLFPLQEKYFHPTDTLELVLKVFSGSPINTIKLESRSQSGSKTELIPVSAGDFAPGIEFKKKLRLARGANEIEITVENVSGHKVSSIRKVDVGSEVAEEKGIKIVNPVLTVKQNSITFADASKDGMLSGNESAVIQFVLTNSGRSAGKELTLLYSIEGNENDIIIQSDSIGDIAPGQDLLVTARLIGKENLRNSRRRITLTVMEHQGFDTDPVQIDLQTKSFEPPALEIADLVLSSMTGNRLKRSNPAALQVLVQNKGLGSAEEVMVAVDFPENIFLDGPRQVDIGTLAPGELKKLEFEFIPTSRYKNLEIPIKIKLTERLNKYGSEKMIVPVIDQQLTNIQFNVPVDSLAMLNEKQKLVILPISLRSGVDIKIPVNTEKHPNRYALVIGNEDYVQFQPQLQREQNVAFARNDAMVFRDYLVQTLGVSEKNVFLLLDATRGQITRELERISQLARLSPDSEVIFYYAGHGLPDFETRKGYIIPVDVSGVNIRDGGISLADLYAKLASTGSSRITVFLDACFSGGGRGENGLLAARTVKIKPDGDLVDGNMIVFTATSSEEMSLPLKAESHGLFTYFILRKLMDTSGRVTMMELRDYLKNEVPKSSLVENGIKQSPQVLVSPKLDQQWLTWKF
jgi:hypothetical protein